MHNNPSHDPNIMSHIVSARNPTQKAHSRHRQHCKTECPVTIKHPGRALRDLKGGRVLLTEIPLPRIARRGTVRLVSTGGQARNARIEKVELDEGFQPHHPPFRCGPERGARRPMAISINKQIIYIYIYIYI